MEEGPFRGALTKLPERFRRVLRRHRPAASPNAEKAIVDDLIRALARCFDEAGALRRNTRANS